MLHKKDENPNYHSHKVNVTYVKRYLRMGDSKVVCYFIIIVGAFLKVEICSIGTLGIILYFK